MSELSFYDDPMPVVSDVGDVIVCFALATLYLQKRDERRGVHRLAEGDDSDGRDYAASVAVKTSGDGGVDQDDM